ncbi:MAG: hypothetical protein ACTHJM_13475 [Marmoricola sp.]
MFSGGIGQKVLRARPLRIVVGGLLLTALGAFAGVQYADAVSASHPAGQLPHWLAAVTPAGQHGPATASEAAKSPALSSARPSVAARLATGAVTTISCGQVIKASTTLMGSLVCPGNAVALTLAGTSVTLNLNGFAVISNDVNQAGSGSVGILVTGTSDTLEKGTVFGFDQAAIQVGSTGFGATPSKDTVTNMLGEYSTGQGIEVGFANAVTVSNSMGVYNAGSGIFDEGTGTVLTGDHASGNYTGFDEEGFRTTLKGNFATSNGANAAPNGYNSAGFFVIGDTTMIGNVATDNYFLGIDNYAGGAIDGGGNLAHGNDFYPTTNPTNYPIQCQGITCG